MKVVSWIIIAIGFLITFIGSLGVFYGLHTAMTGMGDSAASGIGQVAWGMSFSYVWSYISLFGCFVLGAGIAVAALAALFGKKS